jgi:tetratricopeptide (TPR) repeat protein
VSEAFADMLSIAASLTVVYQPTDAIDPESQVRPLSGSSLEGIPRLSMSSVLAHNGTVTLSATMRNSAGHVIDEWHADDHVSELPRLLGRTACGVAAALGVRLTPDEERTLANERPIVPQSYLSYLTGRRHLSEGTEASCLAALADFGDACVGTLRDPRPHAAVVEASIAVMESGCSEGRDLLTQNARAELARAVELDGSDPEALFAAAEVAYRLDWSPAGAESRLRHLLASRPGHWRARLRLAECLVITGKFSDAVALAAGVVERQPFSFRALLRAGRVFHFARDYDRAVRVFATAVECSPDSAVARFDLALTRARCGDPARRRAREECGQALATRDGTALMAAVLGNGARARGRVDEYRSAKRLLAGLQSEAPVPSCCFAILDTAFGDTERPLEYWDTYDDTIGVAKFFGFAPVRGALSMYLDAAGLIVYFGLDPAFETLADVPALQALRARLAK